jgi:prefoldin subunit 5
MTNNDSVVRAFLEVFHKNPEIFDQDLQNLDQKLTDLENQPTEIVENQLIAWYQDEKRWDKIGSPIAKVTQRINDLYKEIKQVPPRNPSEEDLPITNNMRELRESVKERLEDLQKASENKPSDDGKQSK